MYSINFTENDKNFCLSLHFNGANSYLFLYGTEIHKFKAKGSEIVANPLCLDFSVDYDAIVRHSQIFNGKEWHSVKCLDLLKKCFYSSVLSVFYDIF